MNTAMANNNPTSLQEFDGFLFGIADTEEVYNLRLESERVRLRDYLDKIGFFESRETGHMYFWFTAPTFTMQMFNNFIESLKFYNMIKKHQTVSKNELQN